MQQKLHTLFLNWTAPDEFNITVFEYQQYRSSMWTCDISYSNTSIKGRHSNVKH